MMSKRFNAKELASAMGKTKADPDQGFKGDDDHNYGRVEPLGTLKKGKNKKQFGNVFSDDGTLEQKYSIKKNEQEAKLVSTVGPHQKREAQEIELIEVECVGCGKTFEVNPALVSTEYYRCNECCRPNAKQKRMRRFG